VTLADRKQVLMHDILEALDPQCSAARLRELCIIDADETFDVLLEKKCFSSLEQIKLIREYFELGLQEAMQYLDNLPALLNQPRSANEVFSEKTPQRWLGVPREQAESLQEKLQALGGRLVLQPRVFFDTKQSRQAAQNPGLPRELFWLLTKSAALETRSSLAKNPAAPKDFLIHAAQEFPVEVLHNVTLPMLIVEDPDLAAQLPMELHLRAVRDPQIPRSLVLYLLSWEPLRRIVAEEREALPEWLSLLADDDNWIVRFWVAKNTNTSTATLQKLIQDLNKKVQQEAQESLRDRATKNPIPR
jgi:ribosomal protein L7/L12